MTQSRDVAGKIYLFFQNLTKESVNLLYYFDNFITESQKINKEISSDFWGYESYATTPLHFAIAKKNIDWVFFLLKKGASVDTCDSRGRPPLHFAVDVADPKIVSLLLENGANVNAKDEQGRTPLFFADHPLCINSAKLLLQHHADINALDFNGETVLHHVVRAENVWLPVVRFLVESGVNIYLKNKSGQTALDGATEREKTSYFYLANQVANNGGTHHWWNTAVLTPESLTEVLFYAVSKKILYMVKRLCGYGAKVTVYNSRGFTPLHIAAFEGHAEIISCLLEHGADIAARSTRQTGFLTPLHSAGLGSGDAKALKILLSAAKKDTINAVDAEGNTLLHLIADNLENSEHALSRAQVAVEHGADIFAVSKGFSPLIYGLHLLIKREDLLMPFIPYLKSAKPFPGRLPVNSSLMPVCDYLKKERSKENNLLKSIFFSVEEEYVRTKYDLASFNVSLRKPLASSKLK